MSHEICYCDEGSEKGHYHCTICGELLGCSSHYHCDNCGEESGMMGHVIYDGVEIKGWSCTRSEAWQKYLDARKEREPDRPKDEESDD